MREGIHWRGNHRARRRQQEDNPNQNFVLPSRLRGRRRAAKCFVLCLILCFLTWTILKTFRVPLPISIERLPHEAPTREIVFELFRYYRHPQARNRTLTALNQVHRRSALLDNDNSDAPGRHLLESATQEISDEDEHEGQGVEGNPRLQYDESLKKRKGRPRVQFGPEEALASTPAAIGRWPVLGGQRKTDLDIEAFYVKVPIGKGQDLQEYFMHIDTGSGVSWVKCKGRGRITAVGPNGLFKPKADNFLDCKRNKDLCKEFQEDVERPCDEKHKFRCIFGHEYGDGLTIKGHIVVEDVCFVSSAGAHSHASIAFACADKVNDENTMKEGETTASTDGLIGLGRHRASWLHQLNLLGFISEYVVAICFNPARRDTSPELSTQVPKPAGFLSFGNLYSARAASTMWTANIQSDSEEHEAMYTARLIGIRYRRTALSLTESTSKKRKRDEGVRMGFDTGSDLTYFTKKTFDAFVKILEKDAKSMGYTRTQDSDGFVKKEQRKCWTKGSQKPSANDFGDLVLMFSSLTSDDTTSDLVIEPKYYITSRGHGKRQRTCFNMLRETEFDFGNLGAEVMKGHLFLFNNNLNQIGWRAVQSCEGIR